MPVGPLDDRTLVELKTWLQPWFRQKPSGFGGLPSLASVIANTPGLQGFWKLNESSGTVAADSSGNGYDMTPPATPGNPYGPPNWAAIQTPYSENAAMFDSALGESRTSFPSQTGDLTLGIWAYRTADTGAGQVIGQGDPAGANTAGASLAWLNSGSGNIAAVFVGDTTGGPHTVSSNSGLTNNTWYFLVATRATHIWKLYVNAEVQTATYDDSGTNYNASSGAWIGNVPGSSTIRFFTGDLSYGYIFNRALTAAEILTQYVAGVSAGVVPEGYVLTADGAGGQSFQPPTIEVQF